MIILNYKGILVILHVWQILGFTTSSPLKENFVREIEDMQIKWERIKLCKTRRLGFSWLYLVDQRRFSMKHNKWLQIKRLGCHMKGMIRVIPSEEILGRYYEHVTAEEVELDDRKPPPKRTRIKRSKFGSI